MSLAATIDSLLGLNAKDDSNIKILKKGDFTQKNQNILQKLAFMGAFEEVSEWVSTHSEGQKYIANPSSASEADRLDCLFVIQEPLALALKPIENRRKNGRDGRLIEAEKAGDYAVIADILASAAASYWRDHGFFNSAKELKIASFLKNDEKNQQKKDFQKVQIEHIGVSVDFKKAHKKGAFQEVLDFEETDEILQNIDFEDE